MKIEVEEIQNPVIPVSQGELGVLYEVAEERHEWGVDTIVFVIEESLHPYHASGHNEKFCISHHHGQWSGTNGPELKIKKLPPNKIVKIKDFVKRIAKTKKFILTYIPGIFGYGLILNDGRAVSLKGLDLKDLKNNEEVLLRNKN